MKNDLYITGLISIGIFVKAMTSKTGDIFSLSRDMSVDIPYHNSKVDSTRFLLGNTHMEDESIIQPFTNEQSGQDTCRIATDILYRFSIDCLYMRC